MRLIDKYNCILCKYNKYNKGVDSCFNHREKDEYGYPVGKCKSLSQEEKDKLYELIDKVNPCVAMGSKDAIKRFKEWTKGQVKTFDILDNDTLLCDDKIYLIPVESQNKTIRVVIEG